ncbi:DNA repair protein RecO [Flavobacteriaceae bacterium]|jgi:DNA repair protein RecO (recombination protein O)|nr:DNA repair protein RecO [Flavobacteriaceae bacterium]
MLISTQAISLNYVKYSETSIIVKCLTKSDGLKSYLIKGIRTSKKKKINIGFFQPLTQLELDANHRNNGNLESIRSVKIINPYKTIHLDIVKNSIVMFLSEVLSKSIKEEEKNFALFNFLKDSMIWLDQSKKFSNFHIHFLIKLLSFLGISPDQSNQDLNGFNMIDGIFCKYDRSEYCVNGEIVSNFKSFLGTEFDNSSCKVNTSKQRKELIEFLIKYMQIHLPDFKRPNSLNILYELFS